MSLSMMPPCIVALVGRWCFLARFTPSTMTLPVDGMARMTSPSWPRCCRPPSAAAPAESLGLPGPLQHLDQAPPLQLRQRPRLGHPHAVADAGVVGLVVDVELLGPLHGLAVLRVADAVGDGDDA